VVVRQRTTALVYNPSASYKSTDKPSSYSLLQNPPKDDDTNTRRLTNEESINLYNVLKTLFQVSKSPLQVNTSWITLKDQCQCR